MSGRLLPPEDYCYPDSRNVRIRELEIVVMDLNDTAARLREAREIPPCRTCELRLPCPDHGEAE
jgi:hypothetical protein